MLTLMQHVSCCYSESEMKAEGEGQCAEGGGNCEGQQCLGRMQTVSIRSHTMALFYVSINVASSRRSRKIPGRLTN